MVILTEEQQQIGEQLLSENCEGQIIRRKDKFYHVLVWEKHKVLLMYLLQLKDGCLQPKTVLVTPCSFDKEDEDSDTFRRWLQHVQSMKKTSSEYKLAYVDGAMLLKMGESMAYHEREIYYIRASQRNMHRVVESNLTPRWNHRQTD